MNRLLVAAMFLLTCPPAYPDVFALAELNTRQIESLDRDKTVVVIPGGILEQHGPYLPSYTDGYWNEYIARNLAEAASKAGWQVVMFPTIPLGTGGANEIGLKHSFPGTYAVRAEVLRDIFMDLASELGEQDFEHIFVVHGHGAPMHNRAINQASDYFQEEFGGWMVHLADLVIPNKNQEAFDSMLGEEGQRQDGFSVHAGVVETSGTLFLQRGLVASDLKEAPTVSGSTWQDLLDISSKPDWLGYFGAPNRANADLGELYVEGLTRAVVEVALEILGGRDHRTLQRRSDLAYRNSENVAINSAARKHENERASRQKRWLQRNAQEL